MADSPAQERVSEGSWIMEITCYLWLIMFDLPFTIKPPNNKDLFRVFYIYARKKHCIAHCGGMSALGLITNLSLGPCSAEKY
jgi:hypothetical protein